MLNRKLRTMLNAGLILAPLTFALAALASTMQAQSHAAVTLAHEAGAKKHPLGRVDATKVLHLTFTLPLRNAARMATDLHDIYDPANPAYGHYLKPGEFAKQFGPTEADYDKLVRYSKAAGFMIEYEHGNRLLLQVTGTVAQAEKAFGVHLIGYRDVGGRVFHSPDAEPTFDPAIASIVTGVHGLDDYAVEHQSVTHLAKPLPHGTPLPHATGTTSFSGPDGGLSPQGMRTVYGIPQALTGTGQVMGIGINSGIDLTDVAAYEQYYGITVPIEVVSVPPASTIPSDEAALDVDAELAMAPGAAKVLVYTSQSFIPVFLSRIAQDDRATTVSTSNGVAETTVSSSDLQSEYDLLAQMAMQGQSFVASSGDTGDLNSGDPSPSVQDPCSQAYATCVGGTVLSRSFGAVGAETAWSGSGGGASSKWAEPGYQQGIVTTTNGVPNSRNVPDVAFTASGEGCSVYTGGQWTVLAGTSLGAPAWAGFLALVNQERQQTGHLPLGFANPALYSVARGAGYGTAYRDIIYGDSNGLYAPLTGFDDVTGLGVMNGSFLIDALAAYARPTTNAGYTVTDLGTIGTSNYPTAIDNMGDVAGSYWDSVHSGAYLYKPGGSMQDILGVLGGAYDYSTGLEMRVTSNQYPLVVGGSETPSGNYDAFLYVGIAGMQDLGKLPGGTYSGATAVNNKAQIVGYGDASRESGNITAFLRDQNGMVDLGVLPGGGISSLATGINDWGQVVGEGTFYNTGYQAWMWSSPTDLHRGWAPGGAMCVLGDLPGGLSSESYAVNDWGQVVGLATTSTNATHPFIWSKTAGMVDIDPAGIMGTDSYAKAINNGANVNDGAVVGVAYNSSGSSGFVWTSKTGISDLNNLVPAVAGCHIDDAVAINDLGVIAAQRTCSGVTHTVVLTPISLKPITVVSTASTLQFTFALTAPAPAGGAWIDLGSSNSTLISMPQAAVVPAGAQSVTVSSSVGTAINGSEATITASYGNMTQSIPVTNHQQPWISGTAPADLLGGVTVPITVTGINFLSGTVVKVNGTVVTTQFVNSTTLTATIPASSLTSVGTVNLTVSNPGTGTPTSSAFGVLVRANELPTLARTGPSTATVGDAGRDIDIFGTGFEVAPTVTGALTSVSKVYWNGTPLVVTPFSDVTLSATVPTSLFAAAGTATITVVNPSPGGGTSNVSTFTVYPKLTAPTGVTVQNSGSGQVTLTWNAVAGATSYNVCGTQQSGTENANAPWDTFATSPWVIKPLVNGTKYYIEVAAVNPAGVGPLSTEVIVIPSATVQPPVPTGVTASAGNAQVALAWTGSTGSTYNVYRGTSVGAESSTAVATGLTGAAYTNTGLTNGTKYFYKVTAINASGTSAQSSEVDATPVATPANVVATAGLGEVGLTWTASAGASTYNVYRGTAANGEAATAIATGITATSYTNTGLTAGTKYYFKVMALNSSGSSAMSAEVNATPPSTLAGTWGMWPQSASALRLNVAGNGTANGTALTVSTANGTTAQSFVFTTTGVVPAGDYNFVKQGGAYCVQPAGTVSGSAVQIWACNGSTAQSWAVTNASTPGYFVLKPASATSMCLNATGTTSGSATTIATCAAGSAVQAWGGL